MAESKESENIFLNVIMKLLKYKLTNESENESKDVFKNIVGNNVEYIIVKAKEALKLAETNAKGHSEEYTRILKYHMNVTN